VKGVRQPQPQLSYSLPLHPDIVGGFFLMQPVNKLVVQRTWGLQQTRLAASENDPEAKALSYGPKFTYDEFMDQGSSFMGAAMTLLLAFGVALLQVSFVSDLILYRNVKLIRCADSQLSSTFCAQARLWSFGKVSF
jgi:hypothetical protein